MGGFLIGTDPTLRQTKTPNVDTFAAGVGFTAGSSTSVTLSADPGAEQHLTVFFDGVGQHRSTYSVSGTTLTFDTAIPTGTAEVEATYGVTVPSVTVPDNTVTLAKLAGGTDGELITWDASGDPAAVGAGTSGHFLKSQGAGSVPVFAADNKGTWNIIGTSVASTSASLTITGLDSTYDTYAIAFSDMHPVTNNVMPWLRFGDSSGIDSGGTDYAHQSRVYPGSGTTPVFGYSTGAAQIPLSNTSAGNAAGEGFGGLWFLFRPGDSQIRPVISGVGQVIQTTAAYNSLQSGGGRNAVIDLDRIEFLFSSGSIVSGRMTVWGIAHA